jgi:hypothetical protein
MTVIEDGRFSFSSHYCDSFHGYLRTETDFGNTYPNQHIDSDCFPAGLTISSSAAHDTPLDDYVELGQVFRQKACFTNISRIRSYAKHAAWEP